MNDFLQCKMALSIASCRSSKESSFRLIGDGAYEADLLFTNCLQTPVKTLPCFPCETFALSLGMLFLETFTYFIIFKYFCIRSFELLLSSCFGVSIEIPINSVLRGVHVILVFAIDLDLLRVKARNLGADFNSCRGDWGLEVGSMGRILLLEKWSFCIGNKGKLGCLSPSFLAKSCLESSVVCICRWLKWCKGSSKSKKESSPSSNSWRGMSLLPQQRWVWFAFRALQLGFQNLRNLRASIWKQRDKRLFYSFTCQNLREKLHRLACALWAFQGRSERDRVRFFLCIDG